MPSPNSGLAPERYHVDGVYPQNDANVVTSGGSGFGIMAILAGIDRGYVTREEGLARMERIVSFLEKADRFHGAYPHWWYGDTGKVKPFGQKDNGGDLVETAFLMQGLLAVHQYYINGNEKEKALAARIDQIWKDVDWNWYRNGDQNVLYWHWSPTYGWEMDFPIHGYNECMIMYILAAASPTHGVPAAVYHDGWAQNGAIVSPHKVEGIELHLRYQGTGSRTAFLGTILLPRTRPRRSERRILSQLLPRNAQSDISEPCLLHPQPQTLQRFRTGLLGTDCQLFRRWIRCSFTE